jgi:hypothetical protein
VLPTVFQLLVLASSTWGSAYHDSDHTKTEKGSPNNGNDVVKPSILPNYTKIARKYKIGSLIIIYMFSFLICKGESCDVGYR